MPSASVAITGCSRLPRPLADADPPSGTLLLRPARLPRMDRLSALALLAIDAALVDAGLDLAALAGAPDEPPGSRVAVVLGSALGCHAANAAYFAGVRDQGPAGASPRLFTYTLPSSPLGEISIHLGARGPCRAIVGTLAAGLDAVAAAGALVQAGAARLALFVVVDVAAPDTEAVALVLERADAARSSGRAPRAILAGAGSCFAHDGILDGALDRASALAFEDAGLPPRSLASLPITARAGAASAVAALVDWLAGRPSAGTLGSVRVVDSGGSATALLLVAARR